MLGYINKDITYIYEIEIPSDANHTENNNYIESSNKEYALYETDKFIIRKIIDIHTKKIIKKYKYDKCDVLYNRKQIYYKSYNMALQDIPFNILKKYNIVTHYDFPCVFRTYYNSGELFTEFYHNKGILEGKYIQYELDGTKTVECNFINGKIHDICYVFDENNEIIRQYQFNNGYVIKIDSYYDYEELDKYLIPHKLQS